LTQQKSLTHITPFDADFFAAEGALSQVIPTYQPRPAQIEMAQTVWNAIKKQQDLIVEAGTGTGKTFAYLMPALLSGKKVIISTGTKNLQEQLFNKDLPLISQAMAEMFVPALLKGRANYLCLHRLKFALETSENPKEKAQLQRIESWAKKTLTGDIAEMSSLSETHPLWYHATSTRENCLGQECSDYSDCFLMIARKKAQEADLLVINHHLLCADWSMRESSGSELLPRAEVIVIDEAHQLAAIASHFLGTSLTGKDFTDLADESLAGYLKLTQDMPALSAGCAGLKLAVKNFRLAFAIEPKKGEWVDIVSDTQLSATLVALLAALKTLHHALEPASKRNKELELCFNQAENLLTTLKNFYAENTSQIRWYETHKNSFSLNSTPLDIAKTFNNFMQERQATWIFTSATLSVGGNFHYFGKSLGLTHLPSYRWESPFNYFEQALFYHPKNLPQPAEADFTDKVLEFAVPVLQASRGRAFFLFTSYRALNRAAQLLESRLNYPLLIQGSFPKNVLLDKFRQAGNAILLGTASFWEGIDVRGEALSCVIIDKLPFAAPNDPVLKARLGAINAQGGNSFFEYQVPTAAIALQQGVGRLIRDFSDRGVLMVCDPRLLKKAYGQFFLDSLPAMRRTRDIKDVADFFAKDASF